MGSLMSCKTSRPASFAALVRAAFCFSLKFVGTVMTAELTCFPVKSDADCAKRFR